ncbi:MAG: glutamate--tRNA ligase, partial [Acidobacteriota bacterium]
TKKFRKNPDLPELLEALRDRYAALPEYTIEATEAALRELAEERGVKAGVLIHPTRIALSGSKAGPPLFDLVVVMGRDEGRRHFSHFIEFLRQNPFAAEG